MLPEVALQSQGLSESAPAKVSALSLLWQRSLAHPAPVEVTGSGLLPQMSLISDWSHRGLCLGPTPMDDTGLGLLCLRLLAQPCSGRGSWLRTLELLGIMAVLWR